MTNNQGGQINEKVEVAAGQPRSVEFSEPSLEKLAQILEKQMKVSETIVQELEVIKKHIRWQKIWSTLRFFLIVVPILLGLLYGLLYFPPEIKEALDYYRSLFRP